MAGQESATTTVFFFLRHLVCVFFRKKAAQSFLFFRKSGSLVHSDVVVESDVGDSVGDSVGTDEGVEGNCTHVPDEYTSQPFPLLSNAIFNHCSHNT